MHQQLAKRHLEHMRALVVVELTRANRQAISDGRKLQGTAAAALGAAAAGEQGHSETQEEKRNTRICSSMCGRKTRFSGDLSFTASDL